MVIFIILIMIFKYGLNNVVKKLFFKNLILIELKELCIKIVIEMFFLKVVIFIENLGLI